MDAQVIIYFGDFGIAATLAVIEVIGLTLNVILITVIIEDAETLWTPLNMIVLNRAVTDTVIAVFAISLAIFSVINDGWYLNREVCAGYAFLISTASLANIWNLVVIAVGRWQLIVRPMDTFSIKFAHQVAGFVWICAACISVPPLVGWGSYSPDAGNLSCSVSWEVYDPETYSKSYITLLYTFGFIIPGIIITVSNVAIIKRVKCSTTRAVANGRPEANHWKRATLMIVVFLITRTPNAAFAMAAQYFDMSPPVYIVVLLGLLSKLDICYDPIIYGALDREFLQSLKKLFGIREANGRPGQTGSMDMITIDGPETA